MSSEQNKAIVRRLLEEPWKGNLSVVDELIDPNYVGYDPSIPEPLRSQLLVPSGIVIYLSSSRVRRSRTGRYRLTGQDHGSSAARSRRSAATAGGSSSAARTQPDLGAACVTALEEMRVTTSPEAQLVTGRQRPVARAAKEVATRDLACELIAIHPVTAAVAEHLDHRLVERHWQNVLRRRA